MNWGFFDAIIEQEMRKFNFNLVAFEVFRAFEMGHAYFSKKKAFSSSATTFLHKFFKENVIWIQVLLEEQRLKTNYQFLHENSIKNFFYYEMKRFRQIFNRDLNLQSITYISQYSLY